ncbi:hypothetical protein ABN225_12935, partial [Providencia alcalifaciens]
RELPDIKLAEKPPIGWLFCVWGTGNCRKSLYWIILTQRIPPFDDQRRSDPTKSRYPSYKKPAIKTTILMID